MIRTSARSEDAPAVSAVDRVVAAIRDGLRSGRFVPGQRLVEADLTAAFRVSRGPVREAMRRLVAEGLLSQEHNRGIRVSRMSRADVAALYRVREALEGLAARLAAENIDRGDHRVRLRALLEEMAAAIRTADVDRYYQLNEQLHATIVAISGNSHLQRLVDQLRVPLFRLQFRHDRPLERTRRSHADHKELLREILRGDAQRAESAMRQHIRNSASYLDEMPEHLFDPDGAADPPALPAARQRAGATKKQRRANGRAA